MIIQIRHPTKETLHGMLWFYSKPTRHKKWLASLCPCPAVRSGGAHWDLGRRARRRWAGQLWWNLETLTWQVGKNVLRITTTNSPSVQCPVLDVRNCCCSYVSRGVTLYYQCQTCRWTTPLTTTPATRTLSTRGASMLPPTAGVRVYGPPAFARWTPLQLLRHLSSRCSDDPAFRALVLFFDVPLTLGTMTSTQASPLYTARAWLIDCTSVW